MERPRCKPVTDSLEPARHRKEYRLSVWKVATPSITRDGGRRSVMFDVEPPLSPPPHGVQFPLLVPSGMKWFPSNYIKFNVRCDNAIGPI